MNCLQCKTPNPIGSMWCVQCGRTLSDDLPPPPPPISSQLSSVAFTSQSSKSTPSSNSTQQQEPHNPPSTSPTISSSTIVDTTTISFLKHLLTHGGTLDQKYHLTKEIGRGGMGHVFKGVDRSLGRDIAVKILPPSYNEDKNM